MLSSYLHADALELGGIIGHQAQKEQVQRSSSVNVARVSSDMAGGLTGMVESPDDISRVSSDMAGGLASMVEGPDAMTGVSSDMAGHPAGIVEGPDMARDSPDIAERPARRGVDLDSARDPADGGQPENGIYSTLDKGSATNFVEKPEFTRLSGHTSSSGAGTGRLLKSLEL
jgi:hypothetical protein